MSLIDKVWVTVSILFFISLGVTLLGARVANDPKNPPGGFIDKFGGIASLATVVLSVLEVACIITKVWLV